MMNHWRPFDVEFSFPLGEHTACLRVLGQAAAFKFTKEDAGGMEIEDREILRKTELGWFPLPAEEADELRRHIDFYDTIREKLEEQEQAAKDEARETRAAAA